MSHTPWKYATNIGPTKALIVEEDGSTVFEMANHHKEGARFEALARSVVRDHNLVPELLGALKALEECQGERDQTAFNMRFDRACQNARDAIRKAEGR